MSDIPQVTNPNDTRVVTFHNATNFGFTPEMGCMYDGRPINGQKGAPGIDIGETMILPYHVGKTLALNLAKRVMNTSPAATTDATGIPTGVPIWSADKLEELQNKYLTDLYKEARPVAQSQTDILMAKVEEYKKMTEELLAQHRPQVATPVVTSSPTGYQDKAEVIAELEKRNIAHDKRKNKAELEKLLTV
jgi:hypothetical protein